MQLFPRRKGREGNHTHTSYFAHQTTACLEITHTCNHLGIGREGRLKTETVAKAIATQLKRPISRGYNAQSLIV